MSPMTKMATGPSSPKWYRRLRVTGIVLVVLAGVAMLASFPFIGGDPDPNHAADYRDPSWFPAVGVLALSALVVGLCLLAVPLLHRQLLRRRGAAGRA
jgi:hypothetical protein